MTINKTKNFFRVSAEDFKKIPGSPIAYWANPALRNIFNVSYVLKEIGDTRQGMATSDNDRFLRRWFEVSIFKFHPNASNREEATSSKKKWFPYNKGGDYRKWYGNFDYVLNWDYDGLEVIEYASKLYGSPTRTIKSMSEYFKPSVSWSKVSSSNLAMRYYPSGTIFDVAGCSIFCENIKDLDFILAYMNTMLVRKILNALSPTLNFEAGQIAALPILKELNRIQMAKDSPSLLILSKSDWDAYETSWDFQENPLVALAKERHNRSVGFSHVYMDYRNKTAQQTQKMRELEIENNRIFIEAYGLQDELSPEVPWNEITLTCNPWYRYGKKVEEFDRVENSFYINNTSAKISTTSKQKEDGYLANEFPFTAALEQRLLEDTVKEFISYAVGCMMGRYSPEKQGLILANQGDGMTQYHEKLSETETHYSCDIDGVIPILDDEWFVDDVVAQFRDFLKFTFGTDHFQENMAFIEKALGKDIRKYFVKDFYKDHIQRYKKRPIYWMFSSPKGSFNALIYMHRYKPDTVSIVLNDYLREFRTKLVARKEHCEADSNNPDLSSPEKTKALKEIEKLTQMLGELDNYERIVLYPLATKQLEIDLDDGVKVNYPKFGSALKKIPGLVASDN